MRRLLLVTVLVTVLLVAFAGSALADGPHGYGYKYGNQYGYGMGNYGGYNMGYGGYGGYQKNYYPTWNYCCQYVWNPCPTLFYGYQQNYGYGGYGNNYGGYATLSYGYNGGYGY